MISNLDYINENFNLNSKEVSNFIDSRHMARHRWYYYKEGFSPNLVKTAIDTYNLKSNNLIMDPFNGSGTVTLAAAENNIPSIGMEVNPFTSFIAITKSLNTKHNILLELFNRTFDEINKGRIYSELERYSTFTNLSGGDKWLFNIEVIRAYYGGYHFLENNKTNAAQLLKLILLTSIMEVSNARKDGKCLRYKPKWKELNFTKNDFLKSFIRNYVRVEEDIKETQIKMNPNIYISDSRSKIITCEGDFDLIVTSPPYLNTFDYTDIYRPELFLGKFVLNSESLYKLRLETIRSHIQVKWNLPDLNSIESILLKDVYRSLNSKKELLMDSKIPLMILAYFEDMKLIFKQASLKAKKNAHLWMVISNSAYANEEIPVDLILADIATKNGWNLNEIGVLREIKKRKTRYSPDIDTLRESVIILERK